jgi:hypothetical protein
MSSYYICVLLLPAERCQCLVCCPSIGSVASRMVLGPRTCSFSRTDESPLLFVAVGDTRKSLGAAKLVTSDDRWQELVGTLTSSAQVIAIVPYSRPGTLWEILKVFTDDRLLPKTIFIMPPLTRRQDLVQNLIPWRPRHASRWHDARQNWPDTGSNYHPIVAEARCFWRLGGDLRSSRPVVLTRITWLIFSAWWADVVLIVRLTRSSGGSYDEKQQNIRIAARFWITCYFSASLLPGFSHPLSLRYCWLHFYFSPSIFLPAR